MSGKVIPVAVKPVPESADALNVTGALPVEVRVSVCVPAIVKATSPKSTLLVLTVSSGEDAVSCRLKTSVTPPALAVRFAVSAVFAADAVAVKPRLAVPAGTVTRLGTVTSALSLERATANPPLGAAMFSVIEQLSVPAPEIELFAQVNPVSTGSPVPLNPITAGDPDRELLVIVSCP